MEDQGQDHKNNGSNSSSTEGEKNEPVRSRWTPKPEQILILESIFNSGMVNPPKDETVRIRKLLEKFGSVGDANVFYWFQNRRSRSRRRQRQIQASLSSGQQSHSGSVATINHYEISNSCTSFSPTEAAVTTTTTTSLAIGSSSSVSAGMLQNDCSNELYNFPASICYPQFDQNSFIPSAFCSSEINNSGFITVFINGVATDMPRGPLDMRALCGQDFILFHSSGVPIAVNEYGFLLESLQHGESYFLVPRHS